MNDKFSLQDWLYYITDLHFKSIDLGLDRIRDIAVDLDLLHPAPFVVTIGGTNGKGSTCRLLEIILLNSGMKVGVYTSPHLLSYTERVRINGKELTELLHVRAMAVIDAVRSGRALTYFEFITLSSLYLLKCQNLDVIILEVGLGGRLDATNIVNPDISVVTNVAIDHTDLLGCNYMGIAKEKFGIFRLNKPAIVGDFKYSKILKEIIFSWYGAIPFVKNDDWFFCLRTNMKWCWWNRNSILDYLPCPSIPIENAAVALAAVSCFPFSISQKVIEYSLNTAMLTGRFQIISYKPLIILDVCHNPHAALYLSKRLKMIGVLGRFRLVVGMLSNKNIFDTLHKFNDLVPIWYFTSLTYVLGATALQLASCIEDDTTVRQFEHVHDAFSCAVFDAYVEDCIVVFGSFHIVAPILQYIKKC